MNMINDDQILVAIIGDSKNFLDYIILVGKPFRIVFFNVSRLVLWQFNFLSIILC